MVKMKACLVSELPPGRMVSVEIIGHSILVANVDGTYYAMDGICSHGLADLSRGRLDGLTVECYRHFARYDLRTGRVIQGPQGAEGRANDLRTYPVSMVNGCVTVDL
jgi:nitrite reductase/ring-hydroxylating ferredoxin subunit